MHNQSLSVMPVEWTTVPEVYYYYYYYYYYWNCPCGLVVRLQIQRLGFDSRQY
jgi:hypothetical protein